ncbi:MAG TPA: segregation/condensation protein A, partial [Candidatus Vogelbacteria bacterium]|nr:segregation/condensation protein A [Candidatus Vogelbacteria bacterium]
MKQFVIKTEEFEGPLDLLLQLIEKRKMPINKISLAQVTDDYINHINNNPDIDKKEMANFIIIAATLMLIKSISILPGLQQSEEEDSDMADLERRLKIYNQFQIFSNKLKKIFGYQIIRPAEERLKQPIFLPSDEITIENINKALREVIKQFPTPEKRPQVSVKKTISLEKAINNLEEKIKKALRLRFNDIKLSQNQKIDIIVNFLGLL